MDETYRIDEAKSLRTGISNGKGGGRSTGRGGRREFLRVMGCAALAPGILAACRGGHKAAPAVVGLLYDDIYKKHRTNDDQPEIPERCDAVMSGLSHLRGRLKALSPRPATVAEILLCHNATYIESVRRDTQTSETLSAGGTFVCPASYEVALYAAGGAIVAVDEVMTGEVRRVFCVVRPPGHHACPSHSMGFGIFNNAAIAARYAQHKYKVGKVAIVDWDVHHGNGTQQIFYCDGTVFYFSTHQHPWYPHTGRAEETGSGKGRGCILNCPLPAGSGRKEVIEQCFGGKLLPALDKFKPELVIISAGFDSRKDDPMGRFTLVDDDFATLTRMMINVAAQYSNCRIVSVLEGGYKLQGLASAARAHVESLMS